MKQLTILFLLVSSILISGCSSGESYISPSYDFGRVHKVAVVEVTGPVGGEGARNQISDLFVMELMKKGYQPVERAQVKVILNEQKFQASEVTSDQDAVRAGQILNVPAVVVINVPKFGEKIDMTAKMLDVEDGSIIWMAQGSGTTGKTMATILGAAAGVAVGAGTTGKDDQVLGGIVGGVAGGVLGNMLAPEQIKQVKKIMTKMAESLPYKAGVPVIR